MSALGQKRTCAVYKACPLWAKNGHCAVHSITSSARPSSDIGTVRLSALAVLRLMISSTFVVCTTGSYAGFSPLNPTGVDPGLAVRNTASIAHEAAGCGIVVVLEDRWQRVAEFALDMTMTASRADPPTALPCSSSSISELRRCAVAMPSPSARIYGANVITRAVPRRS